MLKTTEDLSKCTEILVAWQPVLGEANWREPLVDLVFLCEILTAFIVYSLCIYGTSYCVSFELKFNSITKVKGLLRAPVSIVILMKDIEFRKCCGKLF